MNRVKSKHKSLTLSPILRCPPDSLRSPVPSIDFQLHDPPPDASPPPAPSATARPQTASAHLSRSTSLRQAVNFILQSSNRVTPVDGHVGHAGHAGHAPLMLPDGESRRPSTSPGVLNQLNEKHRVIPNGISSLVPDQIDQIEPATDQSFCLHEWQHLDAGLLAAAAENRRVLPESPNGVHVLDGVNYRYYLGIVDILTPYKSRQKMSRFFKTILLCGSDHSSVPPDAYARRLVEFIEDHLY